MQGELARLGTEALDELPFSIRYRYGREQGWDIPTWQQWEKAFRGADNRRYAWGNRTEPSLAAVGGREGPVVQSAAGSIVGSVPVSAMAGTTATASRTTNIVRRFMDSSSCEDNGFWGDRERMLGDPAPS